VCNSLPTRTPIFPNIPSGRQPLLGPQPPDLRTCNALVVPVVPFADVLGDVNVGAARQAGWGVAVLLPGEMARKAEVEQLKGTLGTFTRGDVAVTLELAKSWGCRPGSR